MGERGLASAPVPASRLPTVAVPVPVPVSDISRSEGATAEGGRRRTGGPDAEGAQAATIDISFIVFWQMRSSVRSGVPQGGRVYFAFW